ncbi:MAG TPA: efflux RND transporter periplasmic adaptor subunit [Terriglobales bacterium]|nr:efflux RND transporter periplasmic adaptor subunit [Terriglobales bacterium]
MSPAGKLAVPIEIEAIGNAQPYRSVQVKSMVDGQIVRVLLEQGDDVKAGQLLFQLDKRPFEAALHQAEGRLAQDEATASYNQAEAERDRALAQAGVIAPQLLQQQEAIARSSAAAVQADKAAVEQARVNLGYTDIKAPIDARAGAILVNLGNLVKANDTSALTTLNQIRPIYVLFSIPESQLAAVRARGVGKVPVYAFPQNDPRPSEGMLTFIDNGVDPATGTIKLMATFANRDRRLWPGQFSRVQVRLGTDANAVVVPAAAVQTGTQGKYVYVVQSDGTAQMRPVQTSRTYRQLAVIEKGVQPGEPVIVEGQIKVAPNGKVQVARTVPLQPGPEATSPGAEAGGGPGDSQ